MSGINYGNRYQLCTSLRNRKEGVTYLPKTNKYIVRIITKGNIVKTISQHDRKCDATKRYNKEVKLNAKKLAS